MFESSLDMVQSPPETRALVRLLARYREPDSARAVFELIITAVPFFVIWALMWIVLVRGHWIGLLLAAPAGGLLTFPVQVNVRSNFTIFLASLVFG
jgi:acyl-lipid omega-6 desaturase (Delta-12 desaturase)